MSIKKTSLQFYSAKKYTSVFFKSSASIFFIFNIASNICLAQTPTFNSFSERAFTLSSTKKNNADIWRVSIQGEKPLSIGSANKVSALGFIRLDGAPFSLTINKPPETIKPLNFNAKQATNNIALILKSNSLKKVMSSQLIFEQLFLIDIKNNEIIWKETINEYSRTNGGFKTVLLDFISPDKTKYQTQTEINLNMLFIKAVQTSMPSTDMKAYIPGAPLTFLYAFHKNTYKKLNYENPLRDRGTKKIGSHFAD